MGISIKLEGIGEVDVMLRQLASEIGDKEANSKILIPAVRKAFQPVLATAQQLAPKETGALALSLQVEARRPTSADRRSKYVTRTDTVIAAVTTASGKKMAAMSEGKGLVRSKRRLRKMGLSDLAEEFKGFTSDARAIAQEFGSARNPQHSYLRPALEARSQSTVDILASILKDRILQYRSKMK
jgi:hypothetical protein